MTPEVILAIAQTGNVDVVRFLLPHSDVSVTCEMVEGAAGNVNFGVQMIRFLWGYSPNLEPTPQVLANAFCTSLNDEERTLRFLLTKGTGRLTLDRALADVLMGKKNGSAIFGRVLYSSIPLEITEEGVLVAFQKWQGVLLKQMPEIEESVRPSQDMLVTAIEHRNITALEVLLPEPGFHELVSDEQLAKVADSQHQEMIEVFQGQGFTVAADGAS